MKIFGKRIGRYLSLIVGNKPKQIVTDSEEEMKHYTDLVKKTNEGNEEAFKELQEKIKKESPEEIENNLKQIEDSIKEIEKEKKEIEFFKNYDKIKKSDFFESKTINGREAFFLKGFNAELPPVILDEFISYINEGKDLTNLIKFWKLSLLNENEIARRDLYKFITKQKLFVGPEGYFIAFRQVVKLDNKKILNNTLSHEENDNFKQQISLFVEKVKKWRKGRRSFDVYYNNKNKQWVLKPVSSRSKNEKDFNLNFEGTLHDLYESIKLKNSKIEENNKEQIYTDNHTKTMIIKMLEPVKISRSLCNKDNKISCSRGLHVGSQKFVGKGGFGNEIIAVLVNPQHVVAVPYEDAHKMRVCEYFPFMILNQNQLENFHKIDITPYAKQYKKIEEIKLKKALEVVDTLNDKEFNEFSIKRNIKNEDDLNKLLKEIEKTKNDLEINKKSLSSVLDDDISKTLNIEEIKNIIQSRLN